MRSTFSHKLDRRELPAYSINEAAHYLRVPASTIRWWVTGRYYNSQTGSKRIKPIIELPDGGKTLLSFINLVEIHVLDAIRRQHRIPLAKVRTSIQFLKRHFTSKHPLADKQFETDGANLFFQHFEHLINISEAGQLAIRELLQAHLQRIERDSSGLPLRLFPFTRKREINGPMAVMIDPYISFGRPSLAGTGIATAVIAERFQAGESVEELAKDYGRSVKEIEEAIRCELHREAA